MHGVDLLVAVGNADRGQRAGRAQMGDGGIEIPAAIADPVAAPVEGQKRNEEQRWHKVAGTIIGVGRQRGLAQTALGKTHARSPRPEGHRPRLAVLSGASDDRQADRVAGFMQGAEQGRAIDLVAKRPIAADDGVTLNGQRGERDVSELRAGSRTKRRMRIGTATARKGAQLPLVMAWIGGRGCGAHRGFDFDWRQRR